MRARLVVLARPTGDVALLVLEGPTIEQVQAVTVGLNASPARDCLAVVAVTEMDWPSA